jgi:hypothetical protein
MSKRIVFPALIAAFALIAVPVFSDSQPTPGRGLNQPAMQVAPAAGAPMATSTEAALKHDLETAKKKVAELTKALDECKKGSDECRKARDAAQAKANVRMFCADNVTSKNSLGATERCAPYVCSAVSGLCVKRCATAADCAPGFGCDAGACTSNR